MPENKTKILVLSCGTGGGHNSAAHAIVDKLNEKNVQADFIEYLEIINPKLSKQVNNLYISTTKGNGKIFKGVYKLGELYEKTKITSPVYGLNSLAKDKLYTYIKENNYNYVVTTHLFAAHALTAIKKEHDIHFIQIATDYKSIPFWEETNPDYFVIPHKDLLEEFENKGFKKEILKPYGIPVSSAFSKEYNKEEILKELNFDNKYRYILIMTGSMGFGNILELVKKLDNKLAQDIKIIVACGKNKEIYQELNEKYEKNNKIILLEFTKEIYKYMNISEIVLTKPGGLTTTETATANIPIIHTMPIPGCENYNAQFFADRKMSVKCDNIEEIILNLNYLLENKKLQQEMKDNQRKYIDKNAGNVICDFIIEQCN